MMHGINTFGYGHGTNWLCGPGAFLPGPLGWIVTLLFWGLVIYLFVRLVQALFSGRGRKDGGQALEILQERYAKGEISEEEYQRMKSRL